VPAPAFVVMPLVEGMLVPLLGLLVEPEFAPAACIGGLCRALTFFFLLVLPIVLGVLVAPLCIVVFGIEPPPAPAAPLVPLVVCALAIAAVADIARKSAAAWIKCLFMW